MADVNFEWRVARQALLEWAQAAGPIDRVLNETLREHKVGSGQRGAITSAVYEMIRFWPILAPQPGRAQNPEWLREFDEKLRGVLGSSRVDPLQLHAKANPSFEKDALKHLRLVHGVPDFLAREMAPSPTPWHLYLHQMFDEAPLTVRLNSLKIDAAKFMKLYKDAGATPSAWVPGAFHFASRWPVAKDPGFQSGLFEIQDEHSQLVSLLAEPKAGESVLDMCAGAGGKTLHMASLMEGKGEIVAYDIAQRKLHELATRARRAGLTNVRLAEALPSKQKFDLVVIDAPCGGLGTLRRNPDRLYRFTESEAKKLATVQLQLLQRGREMLKPGGRLLYATCTVRTEENIHTLRRGIAGSVLQAKDLAPTLKCVLGAKADAFLTAAHATPAAKILADALTEQDAALRAGLLQMGPSSQTSGGLSGDGFFLSLVH